MDYLYFDCGSKLSHIHQYKNAIPNEFYTPYKIQGQHNVLINTLFEFFTSHLTVVCDFFCLVKQWFSQMLETWIQLLSKILRNIFLTIRRSMLFHSFHIPLTLPMNMYRMRVCKMSYYRNETYQRHFYTFHVSMHRDVRMGKLPFCILCQKGLDTFLKRAYETYNE